MHDCPYGQTTPHPPQLYASLDASTQVEPHSRCPAGQAHAPATQVADAGHTLPHAPQLTVLVAVLMQAPPQYV